MKETEIIEFEYPKRLNEILDQSWKIFKSQFIHGRHEINKEAPFQHHFAQIIRNVGNLYSIAEKDLFKVDLETKCDNVKGKSKYIDISCEFVDQIKCAIELKFKTARQGAQDHGRIDAYIDIEALEIVTKGQFDLGKFYMITDSTPYINQSVKGVGTVFATHNGFVTEKGKEFWFDSKGREDVRVNLRDSYQFKWEKINDWYFLDLTVNKENPRTYSFDEVRKTHKQAYEPWTTEADEKLEILFCEGKTIKELSGIFNRNDGAIRSRIKKLELKEKYSS
ncbi:hypothetical protein [uncultured Tenacibaculum sp.]|uniref:hypothetical protein n=1 Tax=uncultured Tenacibaculum sp. TaxID=174713 RepID=UPI00262E3985|nr:hypothetical protein [uncultured Tenacibaculum sp.]